MICNDCVSERSEREILFISAVFALRLLPAVPHRSGRSAPGLPLGQAELLLVEEIVLVLGHALQRHHAVGVEHRVRDGVHPGLDHLGPPRHSQGSRDLK